MRVLSHSRVLAAVTLVAGVALLAGCATTSQPQQFRTFFLPPAPAPAPAPTLTQAPPLSASLYANELPSLSLALPSVPRPSDAEFLIQRANARFAAGKKDFQDGRTGDARQEFNRAIDVLLSAPENLPDRSRVEQRLEELIDAIYPYDEDPSATADDDADAVSYDKRPLDDILEMTFPVDPSLRNKVRAQVQATASQLPLEESDAVISYINFFSSERGKKILIAGLKRSGRYRAMIERILAQEGVPEELIFVAQAESGFLPHAMSNKRCVGLWQFAKFRGEEYGLAVTSATDERMDPEKATRAAARHLHDLYNHLGDWYLAMAAYDCGPQCVDNAVMRTGYADFWALRRLKVLPKETANYVPAILAMVIMSKNAKDYGLDGVQLDDPVQYDTVELETSTSLDLVAAAVDRPVSELRELNPALLRAAAPAGYKLHLPQGTMDELEAAFSVIPRGRRDAWRIHRVESGDTLASLAKQYRTTVAQLRSANRDRLPEVGELAAIPVAYPNAHRVVRHSSSRRRSRRTTRRVSASRHPSSSRHARKSRAAVQHTKRPARGEEAVAESSKRSSRPRSGA